MSKAAIFTGLILIIIGFGGFAAAGFEAKAITALIPAFIGFLISLCGWIANQPQKRKHALHAASVLGLLGFILPAGRLGMLITKENFEWKLGSIMLLSASIVSLAFLLLCINSFIQARKNISSEA